MTLPPHPDGGTVNMLTTHHRLTFHLHNVCSIIPKSATGKTSLASSTLDLFPYLSKLIAAYAVHEEVYLLWRRYTIQYQE